METFSEFLRKRMRELHISQKELATRSGISAAQVSRIVNGIQNPGKESIKAFAPILKLPPEELFKAAGYPVDTTTLELFNHRLNELPPEKQRQVFQYIDFLLTQPD